MHYILVCRYAVHERCANRAPANCISTYTKTRKIDTFMLHHWIEGNCPGRYFFFQQKKTNKKLFSNDYFRLTFKM